MYCPKCGRALPDNAKYCTVCGAEIKFNINSNKYNVSDEIKAKKTKLSRKNILIGAAIAAGSVLVLFMAYAGHILEIGGSPAQVGRTYTQPATQSTTAPAATEKNDENTELSADTVSEATDVYKEVTPHEEPQEAPAEYIPDTDNIYDVDLSWVSLYRTLISYDDYGEYIIDDVFNSSENPTSYGLYDMNLDGIPELIMSNGAGDYGSSHGIIFSVSESGDLKLIGNAGYRNISFWHLQDGSDNALFMSYPGLFHWTGNSGTYDVYYYSINEYGELVETCVVHGEEKPLEDGTYSFDETRITTDDVLYEAYLEGNGMDLRMKTKSEIEAMSYNSFVDDVLGGFIDYQAYFFNGVMLKILIPWSMDELFTYETHELSGTSGIYFYDNKDKKLLFAIVYSTFPDDLLKQSTFTQTGSIYAKDVRNDGERMLCPIGINRYYLNDSSADRAFLDNQTEKLLGMVEIQQYGDSNLR